MTPTQRTLKALRDDGYQVGIVERYIGPMRIRVDLFHIIDLIAIKPGEIVGVQSTGTAFSQHKRKLTEEYAEASRAWLEAGGSLWLYGWRKVKVKRGGKAMVYQPRIQQFALSDLQSSLLVSGEEARSSDPARGGPGDPDQARDRLGEQSPALG